MANLYKMQFNKSEWEEVEALVEPFCFKFTGQMTRPQWIAIAHMAMGKAQRIEEGDYGGGDEEESFDPATWAYQLRGIADVILTKFRPGDGQV